MLQERQINSIHFPIIHSTNDWVKEHISSLDPSHITCVTADEQTAGRGRLGRRWISPKNNNIYATFYFRLPAPCLVLANIGQILSLSCIEVLQKTGLCLQIKWPNDLLLEGKKTGGILCETQIHNDFIDIILGIGLNVHMPEEILKQIDQPATSLQACSGKTWDLSLLTQNLLMQFLIDCDILLETGFASFQSRYESRLAYKGTMISLYNGTEHLQGICQGISAEGKLVLALSDGSIAKLSAGEVSVLQ